MGINAYITDFIDML